MKSLYDEDWRYNKDAQFLDTETNRAIQPLFQEFVKRGYNPREIAQIMTGVITENCLEAVLDKSHPLVNEGG